MTFRLVSGDCLDALAEMPEASVDAVVTDPPYGLEFMGKDWDGADGFRRSLNKADTGRENQFGRASRTSPEYRAGQTFQQWTEVWAAELLRVLKPGGHLLAFGGTRTYHRLACGIEDAGFEVRDCLAWMYGSGFPKSLDVSKAIDKAAGAERELVGERLTGAALSREASSVELETGGTDFGSGQNLVNITAPATPAAQKWQGWGTALKPAYEPIILARKPLTGTVAANVQEYGTGALNIDGGRVGTEGGTTRSGESTHLSPSGAFTTGHEIETLAAGRWPANVTLDPEAGAMLDEQSGEQKSGTAIQRNGGGQAIFGGIGGGENGRGARPDEGYGDTGGASRFFYCAKASRGERNAGLDGFEERFAPTMGNGIGVKEHDPDTATPKANHHPTVKPLDLMRYLCRLVTPPGGTVLDPFTGSGTTGIAAGLEGFDFIGIEREAEYREIAEARLKWWADKEGETAEILRRAGLAEKERERAEAVGQASLFDTEAA